MVKLPKSTLEILKLFIDQESVTPNQIYETLTNYEKKDLKYGLRRLREKGIIIRIPNLFDMRRVYYRLATLDEFTKYISELKPNEIELYHSLLRGTNPDSFSEMLM